MKIFKNLLPCTIAGLLISIFFYKSIFLGNIPFPGDLLISEYKPWQTYSYLGYNPGSIPHKAQYPDTIRQLYPWKTQAAGQIKKGILPLWNPYNFSGTPLLGNFQSAVFYPFNLLYFLFSQPVAWTILVMLQPFFAFLFMYIYIRSLGGSRLASIFGSITYAFSLFSTVWLEYNTIGQVTLWLPLACYAIDKIAKRSHWFWYVTLILTQASMLLAGHPQIAFYSLLFIGVYAWYRAKSIIKLIGLSTLLTLGISAVQLIPGIELSMHSARSPHNFSFLFQKILIQPQQLLMMIIPNIFGHPVNRTYYPMDTFIGKATYIGIIPLFFLLSALRLKTTIIKFFATSTIIILILMTANPFTFILYKLNIPIFSASSPNLMTFLLTFSLSIVTSLGLDFWIKEKHSLGKLAHRSLTVVAGFLIVGIVFSLSSHALIAQKAILYSFALAGITLIGFFVAIIRPKFMILVLTFLLIVHSSDLFFHFQKFNPFVPKELVFPNAEIMNELQKTAGINRFWGYGSASIEANFATQYQIFSPDGYDPLYSKRYGEFIGSSRDGKIPKGFTTQTRSDATVAPGYGEKDMAENPYRLRVLDMLGVKYVLDRTENNATSQTFPPERFTKIYDQDGWKIMENKNAAPRIFLSSSYQVFKKNEEFEKIFFDKGFNPTQTVLLEQSLEQTLDPPLTPDTVTLKNYESNRIDITTVTDGSRLLFLSDTYYPGWKAFMDGKETKIYRANYTFRAILVPKGEHTIRLIYDPMSFKIGVIISIASFIFLIGFLSFPRLP